MHINIKEIVVYENDNLLEKLLDEGVDIKFYKKQLKQIGSKIYNNKIGFIRLASSAERIEIKILPKIIKKDEFSLFVNRYFKLRSELNKLNLDFKVEGHKDKINIINKIGCIDEPRDLIDKTHLILVDEVYLFFKKIPASIKKNKKFTSMSLEGELDIYSNITDPLPTRIHQVKEMKHKNYHQAKYAHDVLSYLYINNFFNSDALVRNKVSYVMKFLQSKFFLKKEKVLYQSLNETKYAYIFNGRLAKKIYLCLKLLLGKVVESPKTSKETMAQISYFSTNYIFFEANKLYELIVYKQLCSAYSEAKVFYNVPETKSSYCYVDFNNKLIKKMVSNPDYKIVTNEKVVLADAKWKSLDQLDASFDSDYLKLYRDCKAADVKNGLLIYPYISSALKSKKLIKNRDLPDVSITVMSISPL